MKPPLQRPLFGLFWAGLATGGLASFCFEGRTDAQLNLQAGVV
jgi:hypothetical protein